MCSRSPISAGIWIIMAAVVLAFVASAGRCGAEEVRIGVLAKRGEEIALREWSPLGAYLTEQLDCCRFVIVPLDFDEIIPSVKNKDIEFVFTNPGFYVELETLYGVSRIATLKNRIGDDVAHEFGGVIFTLAGNREIGRIEDLAGRSFSAVESTSFGGWHAPLRELIDAGIDPGRDFAGFRFRGTHDAVVMAVLNGESDAGAVRTDTLENMSREGRIALDDFSVLESEAAAETGGFPFLVTTRLYPEWPIAKLEHTPLSLAEDVSSALIRIRPDNPAAVAAGIEGWTIPSNYQPVHDCLREVRAGPYENYGQISPGAFFYQYRYPALGVCFALAVVVAGSLYVARTNRKLVAMQAELRRTGEYLEQGIRDRTAELEASRDMLERDIEARIRTEQALKQSENSLRTLSRKLLSVQEKERLRLSKELHDELGQKLAGLFLEIEFLKQKEGVDTGFLENAREILKRVNDDLDKLYMGLRPAAIDKLGLSYAVEALVREYREHGIYEITADIQKVGKRDVDPNIAIDLYRIIQESLNNIAKHSGADKIGIKLERAGGRLQLEVKDNGAGFDVDALDDGRGFGLLGMRERVEQHGGEFHIESRPGAGASVTASITIDEPSGSTDS